MSTKLYNGYKLNDLSIVELKEFMNGIKKRLHEIFAFEYRIMITTSAINIIDRCIVLDYMFNKTGDATDIENFFVELLHKTYNPTWIVSEFGKDKNNLNLNYALNHFLNYEFIGSVKNVAHAMIEQKNFICDVKKTAVGCLDLQNQIVLFPINGKILFLAYGNILEKTLSGLLRSKKKIDREFRQKYGFEYYGFWDNTDKPHGISQKIWDVRRNEWDKVLSPNYIPSLQGICSEFISNEQFMNEMQMNFEFDGGYIVNDKRVKNIAIKMVQETWMKTQQVTMQNVVSLVMDFEELKNKGIFDEEICKNYDELKNLLPVVTKEMFSKRLIDFAPNYMKKKGLE